MFILQVVIWILGAVGATIAFAASLVFAPFAKKKSDVLKVTPQAKTEPMAIPSVIKKIDMETTKPDFLNLADFHINLRFNDSFSSSVSFFKKLKLVKRRIRAISPSSNLLMIKNHDASYYDLPELIDFDITSNEKIEEAVADTERLGIKFIEQLMAPITKPVHEAQKPEIAAQAASPVVVAEPVKPVQAPVAVAAPTVVPSVAPKPPPSTVVTQNLQSNRATETVTVGRVAEMGMRKMLFGPPNNKREGETFETSIEIRGGDYVSLRGVRLQELFRENGIRIGDHVEIQSLGKSRVNIGDSYSSRNEYSVKVLERQI